MLRKTNSTETFLDGIDQLSADEILSLESAGCSIEEICNICRVEPALVKKVLSTDWDVSRIKLTKIQERSIFNLIQRGNSLSKIAEILNVSKEQVAEVLYEEIQLSDQERNMVIRLMYYGYSLEEINRITTINLKLLRKILTLNHEPKESKDLSILRSGFVEDRTEPDRIYSYLENSSKLCWTNLETGIDGAYFINHSFKWGSSVCEVLGGPLIITGGNFGWDDVVSVDVSGDSFEVTTKSSMKTSRMFHSSIYCKPYVYAIGGCNREAISKCERYLFNEDEWEVIPALPTGCSSMGVVVSHSALLALGGRTMDYIYLDLVQELNLVTLTWRILPVKLPKADYSIACFNVREVYFVMDNKLFTLNDQGIKQVKALTGGIVSYFGPSYYRNCKIYSSNIHGPVRRLEIGSLSY